MNLSPQGLSFQQIFQAIHHPLNQKPVTYPKKQATNETIINPFTICFKKTTQHPTYPDPAPSIFFPSKKEEKLSFSTFQTLPNPYLDLLDMCKVSAEIHQKIPAS